MSAASKSALKSTFVPKKKRVAEQHNQPTHVESADAPTDLIVVARIGVAYGVKGWVKIHPFSRSADALQSAATWWIAPYIPEQSLADARWQAIKPQPIKPHGDTWVGTCASWPDRTAAEAVKGWQIAVSRADFPETEDDEFYWTDLLDAEVVNQDDVVLGRVIGFLDNAAQTVLHIQSDDANAQSPAKEYLIPFVAAFVGQVSLDKQPKRIEVTWDVDATA